MDRLSPILRLVAQWTFFAAWSSFWMTAAIVGRLVTGSPEIALCWARRYWGRGLVWGTGCRLQIVPGFVPTPGQPYIFVMNHQSMFDIVVAFVAIPANIRFVAKKALRSVPFLGWYMRATGMVFIDRGDHAQAVHSLEQACQKIRSGANILVYPEGTRAKENGPILPFKKGPFIMAIQAGVPIVPVAIEGSGRLLPTNTLRITPGPVRVILGTPIPTAGLSRYDRLQLMSHVRDSLIDLHIGLGGQGGDKAHGIAQAGTEGVAQREQLAADSAA